MRYLIIYFIIVTLWPLSVSALTIEQFEIIKISDSGKKAVVRINSGKLQIVREGQKVVGRGMINVISKNYIVRIVNSSL